jgi:DNA-binding NarL/FixJ family response regulator
MTDSERTAVLLDPHPLWMDALGPVLKSLQITVVGKTFLADRALSLIEAHKPDVFLVDTAVNGLVDTAVNGGAGGPALVRAARALVPSLHVIALCGSAEPVDIDAAFKAGAVAYIVKTAAAEDVAATIRQVFHHSVFFAPTWVPASVLPAHGNGASARTDTDADAALTGAQEDGALLTRREREILALVAEGHSNRQLAKMLWVTEQTVKFHLSNIYRKVGASNRTEASRWAHAHSILNSAENVA